MNYLVFCQHLLAKTAIHVSHLRTRYLLDRRHFVIITLTMCLFWWITHSREYHMRVQHLSTIYNMIRQLISCKVLQGMVLASNANSWPLKDVPSSMKNVWKLKMTDFTLALGKTLCYRDWHIWYSIVVCVKCWYIKYCVCTIYSLMMFLGKTYTHYRFTPISLLFNHNFLTNEIIPW